MDEPRKPYPSDVSDDEWALVVPYTYVTTREFLSHYGFNTLRDLPDMEALEDAGLLSKDKLLAGEFPVLPADETSGSEPDLGDDDDMD